MRIRGDILLPRRQRQQRPASANAAWRATRAATTSGATFPTVLEWANQVVEGVLKKHPGKFFGCLAYSEVAAPPSRVKLHPNIIPYMTYDRMKWADPEIRAEGERMTQEWHRTSPTIGWYDYIYGSPYCLPRVYFDRMAESYRFARANGVKVHYAEAYPNWGEGPKLYISLKLQWNPDLDVDLLLREWYERAVGPAAAPELAAYYAHWEKFWTERALKSRWFSRGGQYLAFNSPLYLADVTASEIAESRRRLENVVAKAQTPAQKARARLLLQAFEYYEASALAYPKAEAGSARPPASEAEALAAIGEGERQARMAEQRLQLAKEWEKDLVLAHPLSPTRFPLLSGRDWGGTALWRAFDWLARGSKPYASAWSGWPQPRSLPRRGSGADDARPGLAGSEAGIGEPSLKRATATHRPGTSGSRRPGPCAVSKERHTLERPACCAKGRPRRPQYADPGDARTVWRCRLCLHPSRQPNEGHRGARRDVPRRQGAEHPWVAQHDGHAQARRMDRSGCARADPGEGRQPGGEIGPPRADCERLRRGRGGLPRRRGALPAGLARCLALTPGLRR